MDSMLLPIIVAIVVILILKLCFTSSSSKVMKYALRIPPNELSEYKPQNKPFSTCDGSAISPIRLAKAGLACELPARTMIEIFQEAVKRQGNKVAFRVERPVPPLANKKKWPPALPLSKWKSWTYSEYFEDCFRAASSLIHIGVKQYDSVCVYGFNAPEWLIAMNAAVMAGAKVAGIYPSDTPQQLHFKIRHSGSTVAIVENPGKLGKLRTAIKLGLPKLKAVVVWDGECKESVEGVPCYSWSQFMDLGRTVEETRVKSLWKKIQPGHCCALIYTSGTTGDPKAVMISHDNILFEASAVLQVLEEHTTVNKKAEEERIISFLPLSHVAGMMVDIIVPILMTSSGPGWVCTFFARPYDLKVGAIGDRLKAVKPTIFIGVPRVWEKIAEKIKAVGKSKPYLVRAFSGWCKRTLLAHQKNCQLGGSGEKYFGHRLANAVLGKVKEALGLEKCKFGFTGAAPITVDTLEYFGSLGIQINEVYGMSECTGAVTWSVDSCHVWGSCGWALPGTEFKVFQAESGGNKECPLAVDLMHPTEEEQGELCYRGRNIMMGYLANPDLGQEHVDLIRKKTAAAIDEEGWLHSGDKGCMDHRGMVRITGRYKELIIGAGGENIAPVPIEDNVKSLCPGISNFIMIGNQRKYNVALVTLKAKGATGEQPGTDDLDGAALGVSQGITTISEASKDKKWIKTITQAITDTNNNGSCCPSNACKIQKFTILPCDFSVEGGELTPTLKTKRSVVDKMYTPVIDKMYATASRNPYVPYTSK